MKPDAHNSADQTEARLNRALAGLPDVPVASNFTTRVMAAIELEENRLARRHGWNWRQWFPRLAVATAAIALTVVIVQDRQSETRRMAMAQSAVTVAQTPMPGVEALKNFDAIQRISQPQHADEELLALLQ